MRLLLEGIPGHASRIQPAGEGLQAADNADAAGPVIFSRFPLHPVAGLTATEPAAEAAPATTYDDPVLALIAQHVDTAFYLARNQDVARANADPVRHYHEFGWRERRNPNAWFDTGWYIDAYADVRATGGDPLLHFIRHGKKEGRSFRRPGGHRRPVADAAVHPVARGAGLGAPANSTRLTAGDLRQSLAAACLGARGLVLSASHDSYLDITGGMQVVIADEQRLFAADRVAYLHISPAVARMTFDRDDPEPSFLRVILDGALLGVIATTALCDALAAPGEAVPSPRSFVVHSALGYRLADLLLLARIFQADHHFYWVHDYSSCCESFNLLRDDVEFCHAPAPHSMACRVCLYGQARQPYLSQLHTLFAALPFHVLAPSAAALAIWRGAVTLPHLSARVHAHCRFEPQPEGRGADRPARGTAADPVRIAFAGHPVAQKGWPLFLELMQRASGLDAYRFFHFSTVLTSRPMRKLECVPAQVDPHNQRAMIAALAAHDIDLVLVLSPWPETFSFVTQEAFAAGADVVALAAGGNVADAVRHHRRGVVFADAEAALQFFLDGSAIEYCRMRDQAGREPGRLLFSGATAAVDPAGAGSGRVETDDPGLLLLLEDRVVASVRDGLAYRFALPDGTERVRLASRHLLPVPDGLDQPRRGVAVAALALDGEPIAPGDARLDVGWHAAEDGVLWTDGDATLETDGAAVLDVTLRPGARYWRLKLGGA